MVPGYVKIFSAENTPRLNYIAEIILGDILGVSWEVITDKRKLGKHPVINYSPDNISGSFKISPDRILFEKGIAQKDISISDWNNLPVFFPTSSGSDLPFDIFGASFFLVTRYEEYLDSERDEYGRFPSSSSLAGRNGFLDRPVIDLWSRELAKAFLKKFPTIAFKRNEYKALMTIDTDEPFAYLGRNIFESLGELIHEKKGISGSVNNRYRVITKEQKDPFDVFDYMIGSIERNNTDTKFFFPVGDRSKYDDNPSWKNEEYRKLILKIAEKFPVGLHPSFLAGRENKAINSEAKRLGTIIGQNISLSRFHYLRLFMPDSYINAISAGISEDYSMGYPDEAGFRAGIARPFFFYDIINDKRTNLRIVPFQIMDAALCNHKQLSPDSAMEIIAGMINETRSAGGLFVSIWHNTTLLDDEKWRHWRKVFEFTLINQKP
jgi:hypothetical protein